MVSPSPMTLVHCKFCPSIAKTNPSPNTIRLCQFRVLRSHPSFQYYDLFNNICNIHYLSEVCKVSLEWICRYLNSWYPWYCRQGIEQYMYGKGKWNTMHIIMMKVLVFKTPGWAFFFYFKLKEKNYLSIHFSDGIRLIRLQHFGNGGIGFSIRGGTNACWYLFFFFCYFYSFACSDCSVAIILWQPWSWYPHCILIYINIGVRCFCLIRKRA